MRHLSLLVAALFLICSAHRVYAQATAEIRGTVQDDSGGVLPGVAITATNELTGVQRTTVSDGAGRFNLPSLAVGTYRLNAALQGFREFVASGVRLSAQDIRQINVVLAVGQITEAVTVTGAASEVKTVGGNLSAVVDEKRIQELPLNGRDPLQLQLLLPGVVQGTGSNRTSQEAPIAVHGLRGIANNYMLDGGDNNDPLMGVAAIVPNPDGLEEFTVQTSNFSAEFGRNMGAVVNAVTKSGTNRLKGSAFEFVRNDAFDARAFFATQKTELRRNQYGGTLGGPIVRDRTFFFASYGGLRETAGVTHNIVVPTQAERMGDFSQSIQKPRDPLTNQVFPGNQIPSNRFDPAAVNVLNIFIPLPNQPAGRYIFNAPNRTNGDQVMVRGDHNLSARQRVYGRVFKDTNDVTNTGGLPLIRNFINYTTWNAAVNHTSFLSSRLVSSAQFTFAESNFEVGGLPLEGAAAGVTAQSLGIKINRGGFLPDGSDPPQLFPDANVTGYFSGGQEADQPRLRRTYQVKEDVSYSRNGHVMKFGGQYVRTVGLRTQDAAVDGNFTFNGQFSGNAYADFLLGRASAMTQGSVRKNNGRTRSVSAYVQDDWQVQPKVTLSLGLRWDPFFAFWDLDQPQPVFRPGQKSTLFRSAPVGLLYAGDAGVPIGGHPTLWNNYAPRVAAAWSINSKTSARVGYGIFYDSSRDFQGPSSLTFTPPYSVTNQVNIVQYSDPYATLPNPFPYRPPQSQAERDAYTFFLPVRVVSIADNEGGGHSHQWNVSVEREVAAQIVVTTAYVGSKGADMPLSREINPAIYVPGATLNNRQQNRIYPQFASINQQDPVGRSRYDGLELNANKRFSHGFTLVVNYTLARGLDNTSGDSFTGQDPLHPDNEWGRADTNVTHRTVTSFLWQLPSPDNPIAKAVFGGWQFNGIVTLRTGTPYSVSSGRDTQLSFQNSRADLVGDPQPAANRPASELIAMYFNPAAFAVPATGTIGNTARNFLTGPGYKNADVSLFRGFTLRRTQMQFRAEAFNAFNTVNLNNPVSNISSVTVGQITSSGPPRIMQFGLRMTF